MPDREHGVEDNKRKQQYSDNYDGREITAARSRSKGKSPFQGYDEADPYGKIVLVNIMRNHYFTTILFINICAFSYTYLH